LILASIGFVWVDSAGVFMLGLEGIMLSGALAGVAGSFLTGSPLIGTLAAMAIGALLALLYAYLAVTRKTSQIAAGFAINLLALGATNVLFSELFPTERARVAMYPVLAPAQWRNIPVLGTAFFSQPVHVWLALILPIVSWYLLYHTSWGLTVRAVGDHPRAVASAGMSVSRTRYLSIVASGIFGGLGGAALTLGSLGFFAPGGMVGGRGFIVMAAAVVGKWNPIVVALVCLLFGAADATQLRFQTAQTVIPYQFLLMLPYLLTIIAVAGLVGRLRLPAAAGKPYDPEGE
jgi:simple sugar transport system permease protein